MLLMFITVLSMFRDSQPILPQFFTNIEGVEQYTDADFEYCFYENDSTDNTVDIINEWLKDKKGRLISEKLNASGHNSHSVSAARNFSMTEYRNKMLEASRPFTSDFTLIIDSDVDFPADIVNQYLKYMTAGVAMTTPNVLQNIKCAMGNPEQDSYYDSYALIDRSMRPALTWSSNPFVGPEDRNKWERGVPVEVYSAFGGIAMVRSHILNKVNWSTDGRCEHWNFCRDVGEYGKILVIPTIKVRVTIDDGVLAGIGNTKKLVANNQKRILYDQCIFKH